MDILAIETSCDETAAAVVRDGRQVLSSVVLSQIEEHRLYGGVVPEIASRRHTEGIAEVVGSALSKAGKTPYTIDAIAVTSAPGLIGALLVGVNFAKGMAYAAKKPLIPVHHIRGHIAANYIEYPQLKPPFLCMVVSGGHSHIYEVLDYTSINIIAQTRDDAAGEAFDKAARVMGFGYPGGVKVQNAAKTGNPRAYKLPRPRVENPYDFSFSGLKTAVVNLVHNAQQKGQPVNTNDLAASFQDTVCEILSDHFIKAAKDLGYKTLCCAGGVSANECLRQMLSYKSEQIGAQLYIPPLWLCGDNAAMIGSQAYYEYQSGNIANLSLNASANMSITGA